VCRSIISQPSEEAYCARQSHRGRTMTEKRMAAIIKTNKSRALDRDLALAVLL